MVRVTGTEVVAAVVVEVAVDTAVVVWEADGERAPEPPATDMVMTNDNKDFHHFLPTADEFCSDLTSFLIWLAGEYPALADVVALVLNLLVLAAFGGLVYLLLSPLLSGGHGGEESGWGRSSSPYYEAFKDGGLLSRVMNSIDYVDTTFAVMKISGDGCRKRVACEMERAAGRNKVFSYATNFFR